MSGIELIRCVTYAAKSTEDIRGSIPDQLRDCRAALDPSWLGLGMRAEPGRKPDWWLSLRGGGLRLGLPLESGRRELPWPSPAICAALSRSCACGPFRCPG